MGWVASFGYPLNMGQNACVDISVGWANGSIVNPTLMPSSVGCQKHATQPTALQVFMQSRRSGNSFIVARLLVPMNYVGHEQHVPDLRTTQQATNTISKQQHIFRKQLLAQGLHICRAGQVITTDIILPRMYQGC